MEYTGTSTSAEIRAVLALLRRQRWVIVLATIAIAAAALASALVATPVYQASVQLIIEPSRFGVESAFSSTTVVQQEIETQLRIITSERVAKLAAEEVGLELNPNVLLGRVSAFQLGETRAIVIAAQDIDPERAAAISQAFATSYLADRRDQALQRAIEAVGDLEARTSQIRERISEIDRDLAISPTGSDSDGLRRERDTLLEQRAQISAQLTTLGASEDLARGGGEIIRDASVPTSPVEPQPVQRTVLGLLLGLVVGLALGWLRDRLDDTIRDSARAIDALQGRPLLARVPTLAANTLPLPMITAPMSAAAEAFRTLHTNLRLSSPREPFASLLVTSAEPGEGKSTVAANLAVAAARGGRKVVLVDADLRRGTLHDVFDVPNVNGLSDVLVGTVDWREALVDVGVANFRLITSGPHPPNPAELLGHEHMSYVLTELGAVADLIILDGPPVLPVADALELARLAAATIVVVDRDNSSPHRVAEAMERLERSTATMPGGVFNNAPVDGTDGGYYYAYYGTSDEPAGNGASPRTRTGAVLRG